MKKEMFFFKVEDDDELSYFVVVDSMVIFVYLLIHLHPYHHYSNHHHHFPKSKFLINKSIFNYITLSEHKSVAFSNTDLALAVRSRKYPWDISLLVICPWD
jgi:hypothetical protein